MSILMEKTWQLYQEWWWSEVMERMAVYRDMLEGKTLTIKVHDVGIKTTVADLLEDSSAETRG